ncbi:restriction endonuclease subunit S [Acinetobacter radioresistens]
MSTDLNMEYQEVKFGEIAKHISKRIEPSETTLEIYVGLEHLDPDSLKITRHGVPSDVAGQKLLVKKEQIIFGKRRAYQRKVAVADWDCICSAHAMVLEAIPGKILPEFLPFFMQSNQFMERAVEISEGSLSPTIKWKTLENQKFIIPSYNEQKKILQLLESIEHNFSCLTNTLISIKNYQNIFYQSLQNENFFSKKLMGTSEKLKLNQLISLRSGIMKTKKNLIEEASVESNVPVYGGNGINGYTNEYMLDSPIVIIGRVGEYCGSIHKTTDRVWVTDNALYTTQVNDQILLDYLEVVLRAIDLNRFRSISGQPQISQKTVLEREILVPTKDVQRKIIDRFSNIEKIKSELVVKRETLLKIKATLLD